MKIKLLAIGKTDNKNLITLIDEYQNRLKHYVKFELEIIPDVKNVKNLSEVQQKEKEGETFRRATRRERRRRQRTRTSWWGRRRRGRRSKTPLKHLVFFSPRKQYVFVVHFVGGVERFFV